MFAPIFRFYLLFIIGIHILLTTKPSHCYTLILLRSVPPLRTMFSNKASLVLLSLVCRQALGYERKSSGQKYLVKTGYNSPAKHLLVETYDSAEGNIIVHF